MKEKGNEHKRKWLPKVIGILLVLIVVTADILMLYVFGASLDKALISVNIEEADLLEARKNGLETAEAIEGEGMVLLENNGVLPLKEETKKINLLGYRSFYPIYGGTGSGGSSYADNRVTLLEALEEEGYTVNPNLKDGYEEVGKKESNTFEVDFSIPEYAATEELAQELDQSFLFSGDCSWESMKEYSDTAVLVFGRTGGENNDLPVSMEKYTKYEPDQSRHYLELNSAELSLLQKAGETFENVIILINSSHAMELGFLEEEGIDAALWIGGIGDVGSKAVADALSGKVNPSGRTADTYPYQVEAIPSYYNFGEFAYTNSGECFDRTENDPQTCFLVEYQEGIYVGYRYFETRDSYSYVTREGDKVTDAPYEKVVQYPFGYGLSYTDFQWEVMEITEASSLDEIEEIICKVKVTNTGYTAGKDVVELYYSPPYTAGEHGSGIQKPGVVLGDYGKTVLLNPGESDIVELKLKKEDMASYDDQSYYAVNGAYVLENGRYDISLRSDAHSIKEKLEFTYQLDSTVVYTNEEEGTGRLGVSYAGKRASDLVTAENQFADVRGEIAYLNRDTWEIQQGQSREATPEQLEAFRTAKELDDSYIDESEEAPVMGTITADHKVTISEMQGKDYSDPLWENLLDQLSWNDMCLMAGANGWGTSKISSIEKPQVYDMDGPSSISYVLDTFMIGGRTTYKSVSYPSEVVIASTWSREMAEAFGDAISREGKAFGVSGWYAPGVNIHRNPFCGRNFEYYSEDSYLSGTMGASVVQAAGENGMYCYLKHFALNEMETNRHFGLCTWASEQSMREIYLKAFEIPVKETGLTALMSSYNNLGTTWAGGCRELLTNVLRTEWGFTGTVLTDNFEDHGFMDAETALAAGGSSMLHSLGVMKLERLKETPSGQRIVRNAMHQYLYTIANSYAMDMPYQTPIWRIVTTACSAVLLLAGLGLCTDIWGKLRRRNGKNNRVEDKGNLQREKER